MTKQAKTGCRRRWWTRGSFGDSRSFVLCWLLFALGSGILAVVSFAANTWLALIIPGAFVSAVILGARGNHRAGMFHALIAMVGVDVAALVFVTAVTR